MEVKVWVGGEGACELGRPLAEGRSPGVVEALLKHTASTGWKVVGTTAWRSIVKLRVGAAKRGGQAHEDLHNTLGIINEAHEARCEVVAFVRDTDGHAEVADAVQRGIELAPAVIDMVYTIGIIGGVAAPTLEAWILSINAIDGAGSMSKPRIRREFDERGLPWKQVAAYVAMIEEWEGSLPDGCDSLRDWIALAESVLGTAIRGA